MYLKQVHKCMYGTQWIKKQKVHTTMTISTKSRWQAGHRIPLHPSVCTCVQQATLSHTYVCMHSLRQDSLLC